MRRLGGGSHGKVDDTREPGRVARRARNRPGNAQRTLLLADRCLRLWQRRTVIRLHSRSEAAKHDGLLAVRERERAVDEAAHAIGDARAVHNVPRIKAPASRRLVRSSRARRPCRRKRRRGARRPIGLVGHLRLWSNEQRHVTPATTVATRVHLRARPRPEAELDLLPGPRREVSGHVAPCEDVLNDLRADELRFAPLLQHKHLVLRAV